jgi:hypothetical protein
MAASPIAILQETNRQEAADDGNFYKKLLYYFELRVPPEIAFRGATTSFVFPLVLGLDSYSISEPFTVEKTPTQGGGLYVEENGIVMRTITLKGHTGFKPRPLPPEANGPNALGVLAPDKRSFGRVIPTFALTPLSGQRHFQYLQDAVFRLYADLKKDASTSRGTQLLFHNPKDKEQWLVVPEKFVGNRTAGKRVLYEYDIELTAVAKGDGRNVTFSEDQSLFDTIKDGIAEVKAAVDGMSGFVNDVTETVGEVTLLVKDAGKVLDGVTALVTAANDFVSGVTDLIEAPLALVNSVAEGAETVADTLVNVVSDVRNIPVAYSNSWLRLEESIHRLGQFPNFFETDAQRSLRGIRERQQISQATSDRAAVTAAPATIDTFGDLGSAPLPGTANRALATRTAGRGVNSYSAMRTHRIAEGDTLVGLASALLGDARLWQEIAILNGLKPPYIDAVGGVNLGGPDNPLPGVLGIGDAISIPNFSRAPSALPVLPVLGVSQEEDPAVQFLGRDFLLQEEGGLFDWVVDTDHGSTDFKTVEGIPNLGQGLTLRLSIERGHNPLYRFVGIDRVIGLNDTAVDRETSRFRVIEAITDDPRVSNVRRIDFEPEGDNLRVESDVEIRGFGQGVNVKAIGAV